MQQVIREREYTVGIKFVKENEHNPQGELASTNIKLVFDDAGPHQLLPDFVKAAIRYRFEELLLEYGVDDIELTEQVRPPGDYATDFNFQCDDDYGLVFWTRGAGMWLVLQEDGVIYSEQSILSTRELCEEALACRDLAWLINWEAPRATLQIRRILQSNSLTQK